MSLFKNLTTDGLEKTGDSLGGFSLFDSDAYLGKIKVAYVLVSDGGATGIALQLDLSGRDYNETIYITNKQGENFFLQGNDKAKKVPLPGFTLINDLCIVCTEKPLAEMNTEEKVVNVYDPAEKKAVPRGVQVITDLIGQEAYFGILKKLENKNAKNDATGKYEPTAETRETNALVKVFHNPTKLTVNEVMEAQKAGTMPESPVFFEAWVKKNKGNVQDSRKIKDGAANAPRTGRPGGPPQANGGAKTSSLFAS